jgi:FlaA1/EpsC-like NDP-sugar epimerase
MLLVKIFGKRYAPRWLIFQIDIIICLISLTMAYALFHSLHLDFRFDNRYVNILLFFLAVRTTIMFFTKTYEGIIRYTSILDAKRIFISVSIGSVIIVVCNIMYALISKVIYIPLSIIIIEFLTTMLLMTSFRILVKIFYTELSEKSKYKNENVIIYGSGSSGLITKRTIDQDPSLGFTVVAFIDDSSKKQGHSLEGIPIVSPDVGLRKILKDYNVGTLIFAIQKISRERRNEIIDKCMENNVRVKLVPPANNWVRGELSTQQIQNIRIEDLLMREPIKLDKNKIVSQIRGKVIMITGAAGSIGSEVIKQLIPFFPKEIILFDQAETQLYNLKLELEEKYGFVDFFLNLGDIVNSKVVESVIIERKPDIVFHAAAYKHVPLMEENPCEAVSVNIQGTKILADLAVKHGIKKFVMISTDKAVNPANIMGATKRAAEIYIQSLNGLAPDDDKRTRFITTRFGNVLASNGSVIPRFRSQIESGGPLTVTHPEIRRFFMTLNEACQLIIEAVTMGHGGEIYVFDMGEPVKIIELAEKMIKLAGLTPYKDIKIHFTGLRSGEKLDEELFVHEENILPTHHPKILIAKTRDYDFDKVSKEIDIIIQTADNLDQSKVVQLLKKLVPEYKSQNSVYKTLDDTSAVHGN